jgi:outer membrane protein assembly factor BamB
MTTEPVARTSSDKPLRLWPGVTAVVLQWLLWAIAPLVVPGGIIYAVIGGVVLGLVVIAWWLFFSRAPWLERLGAIVLMVAGVIGTYQVVHPSVSNGMMGAMLPIYSIPLLCMALVASAAASRNLARVHRFVSLVAAIALACGVMTLIRTGGISGDGISDLHWRWTPSPEDRLLAQRSDEPSVPAAAGQPSVAEPAAPPAPASNPIPAAAAAAEGSEIPAAHTVKAAAEWPGFRGLSRDSIARGVLIDTDWTARPPKELWRRPIGPAWSSFAVHGNVIYTQEQRGDEEIVAAYSIATGQPVWRHRDAARFWESNAGAGPRGTPTLSDDGRVYTLGGTGILNALDAGTGKAMWSRNAAADINKATPDWGFSSSPLVVGDLVVVGVAGQLVAYDRARGMQRWVGPVNGGSYSSPHLMTLDGVAQILQPSGAGLTSVAPDGTVLWEHHWSGGTILQPAQLPEGDVVFSVLGGAGGAGTRRIAVAHTTGKWTTEERWTSNGLKPYFNDFVIHKDHAYGFDGSILASISLNDGARKWKGGRYGNGQLVLLPDQDLLMVLSEEGELVLVRATPDQFAEVARFKAIDGKTWNHPVVVGDVVLVRNAEEMAAFRLPRAAP